MIIMIITVVCDFLGEGHNGTTLAAMNLIRSLRQRGHTVRVVCSDEERIDGQECYVVKKMHVGPLKGYFRKNGVTPSWPDRDVIARALDGADAGHVMTPFPVGNYAARAAEKAGIPITAGFHCQAENFTSHIFMKNFKPANVAAYKVFWHKLYRRVNAVHYPSQFIREVFEKYGGKTNAYVISNGVGKEFVPREKREDGSGEYKILFTGRYSREKSHRILIDAADKSRHREKIRLIFAGEGPLKDELQRKAAKLPLMPVFRFFSREELVDVINSADLYVHPAEIEIEAIACLEAIACGAVPVISDSQRSATRHFAIDDKNLFRCNDSDDLAKKIDYWLDHPEERARRGREYEDYAKQFDFDLCMDRMEQMIVDTVEKAKEGKNHA